jgi:hypothetical protein
MHCVFLFLQAKRMLKEANFLEGKESAEKVVVYTVSSSIIIITISMI